MTAPRCTAGCGRPSPDASLCGSCSRELLRQLLSVPWLTRQLTTTLARLDRVPASAGAGTNDGPPLPFRLTVTQAASTLRHTLTPWVREIAQQQRIPPPRRNIPVRTLATWLARNIEHARRHHDAAQLADEISYAVEQVKKAIDRPPDLFYLGPCDGCRTDLYCGCDARGWPTAAVITCRACSRRYEATERREWLLSAVRDRLATAAEISQAVPALYGREIRTGTIRQWLNRGRLAPRAWLLNGVIYPYRPADHARALVRVGDVLDLASAANEHTFAPSGKP